MSSDDEAKWRAEFTAVGETQLQDAMNRGSLPFPEPDYTAFASVAPLPATSGATHGRPGAPAGDPHDGRVLLAAAARRRAGAAARRR
jgi:hypothetical protein